MKFIKIIFKIIKYSFVTLFVILIGAILWTNFISVGPVAKDFCKSRPVGSTFDRTKAIREFSTLPSGYLARMSYNQADISFDRDFVTIREAGSSRRISIEDLLALPPQDNEIYKITSIGFAKRSCVVDVRQGKVQSSKTSTWN